MKPELDTKFNEYKSLYNKNKESILFNDFTCPHCNGKLRIFYKMIRGESVRIKFCCMNCDFECPIYYDEKNNPIPLYDNKISEFINEFRKEGYNNGRK